MVCFKVEEGAWLLAALFPATFILLRFFQTFTVAPLLWNFIVCYISSYFGFSLHVIHFSFSFTFSLLSRFAFSFFFVYSLQLIPLFMLFHLSQKWFLMMVHISRPEILLGLGLCCCYCCCCQALVLVHKHKIPVETS